MKKLLFICLLFFGYTLQAQLMDPLQLDPKESIIVYDKQQVSGYSIEIPFTQDLVEDAINKRFKKMGVRGKENDAFWEYKNVVIPEIREEHHVDVYIKIDRKSRKEKDISIVSMILTEPDIAPGAPDHAVEAARGTKPIIDAVGSFALLSSFHGHTEGHGIELDIKNQEEIVKKAEKEYENLIDQGEDLQQKSNNIQNDISDNKKNQSKQLEELNKQKDILLNAKSKRN